MESSISSRSLITGNVSTDESRKEIRNSPGAPRLPAKATIFSFHVCKPAIKRLSLQHVVGFLSLQGRALSASSVSIFHCGGTALRGPLECSSLFTLSFEGCRFCLHPRRLNTCETLYTPQLRLRAVSCELSAVNSHLQNSV